MSEIVNITASFPILDELGLDGEGLEKGRLILNPATGEYVFGKSSRFSSDIKTGQRYFWGDIRSVKYVERMEHGSLLSKKHGIAIHLHDPLKIGDSYREFLVLWTSKNDADAFMAAYRTVSISHGQSKELHAAIERKLKTTGRVSIKAFAEEHLDLISRVMGETLDLEKAINVVKVFIEQQIVENKLYGVIDVDKMEYVDRDFLVQEQRIVSINVQMDFNSLLQQLGNKGIALTNIQCTQCGSPCQIPETGSVLICASCNATIQVTDVFEKFKEFLE